MEELLKKLIEQNEKIIEQNKIILTAKISLLKSSGLLTEASILQKAAGNDYLFKNMFTAAP